MPKYKTLRLRQEDYVRLKKIRRELRKKGTESIDWNLLREQDIVDVPDDPDEESEDNDEDSGGDFTWGLLVGLGAAALAYLLLKGGQRQQLRGRDAR